ncbi:MAG TPA: phosphatase PAP2 family protein, partial [Pseudonocardiaceae bacterium]|nr:phosphatase PAP2 family protein [Pseudonocardiaceae bacterium]
MKASIVTIVIERIQRRLDDVQEVDQAVSRWIGQRSPTPLDIVIKGLSTAANHSMLWFAIAVVLAGKKGATRRGAMRGLLAIAATSVTAKVGLKPALPRRRPPAEESPAYQGYADRPTSSSFPSGHAASAAAFTTAVALECRNAGLTIAPLAAAVAYSRVHIGAHWTSDVVAGAVVGSGIALGTQRWWPVRTTDEALARPLGDAPGLPAGAGLVVV